MAGVIEVNFHNQPATHVSRIELEVKDLKASRRFYVDVLGFKVLLETDEALQLSVDQTKPMLTLIEKKAKQQKARRVTGLYHVAILLPTRADLAKVMVQLIKHDIEMGAADHLVSEAIYLDDPDGHGIEIYRDRDPEDWSWREGFVDMAVDPLDAEAILNEINQDTSFAGLPNDTVLGHIHLHVKNLQESERFYTELLGFEVVSALGNQASFLSTEKYHHHIGINTWNGKEIPANDAIQMKSFTITYPSEQIREHLLEALKQAGVTVAEAEDMPYLYDPQGIQIYLSI